MSKASSIRLGVIGWVAAAMLSADIAAAQSQVQTPTGSAVSQSVPQASISGASADYRVDAGDLLNITVYRSPDLQSTVRISTDGTIAFPSLGAVKVAGLTAADIASLLARELRQRGILIDPSVNVLVAEVRSKMVTVMGSVGRPGEIPLDRPGLTLAAVLARAGAAFGTGSSIVTVMDDKGGQGKREQFRIADLVSGTKDREVRAGEILVVQSAPTIYVSGEVGRPGAYPLEPDMTIGQAIALGGGITPRGSAGRIRLTRKGPDGKTETYNDVNFGTKVMPDDLIYVKQRVF